MSLWDERYCDEKYGLERPASFEYFCQYLQQSYPRSIKALWQELSDNQSNNKSNKRIPSYKTLREYSAKWKWTKRAEAYDEYLKNLHFKTKEKEVMAWESEQLEYARERAKYHLDTMQKIHNASNEDFPLTKKPYAEEANERAYNQSIESVYKILHGGVIKSENRNTNKDTVDMKQETTIIEEKSIEEIKKANKQYLKDIFQELDEENKE